MRKFFILGFSAILLQALPDGSVPRLARMISPFIKITPVYLQTTVVVADPPIQVFSVSGRCVQNSLLVVLNTGVFYPGIDFNESLDSNGNTVVTF